MDIHVSADIFTKRTIRPVLFDQYPLSSGCRVHRHQMLRSMWQRPVRAGLRHAGKVSEVQIPERQRKGRQSEVLGVFTKMTADSCPVGILGFMKVGDMHGAV